MSVRKNFSPDLYNSYDLRAKRFVARLLVRAGWSIDDTETYNSDIIALKHNRTTFHEVEIKNVWTGDWPTTWSTIQIPERKKRLFSKVDNLDDLFFWIIRQDTGAAWSIKATDVQDSPCVEVKNRFIPDGEMFFQVPIERATLFVL